MFSLFEKREMYFEKCAAIAGKWINRRETAKNSKRNSKKQWEKVKRINSSNATSQNFSFAIELLVLKAQNKITKGKKE